MTSRHCTTNYFLNSINVRATYIYSARSLPLHYFIVLLLVQYYHNYSNNINPDSGSPSFNLQNKESNSSNQTCNDPPDPYM